MDFVDQIKSLAAGISSRLDHVLTEEATKSALVMPFIQALGYNVFDITEVVPEFDANVGASKKYKLDYAILQEQEPIILIECKHHSDSLSADAYSQLFHYFAATSARIGLLTNGVIYRFYSDLVEKNKLDDKPFLELNMLNLQEPLILELRRLSKRSFNLEEIVVAASELKYTQEIKRILTDQLTAPSDDFVKFFASKVYPGRVSERVKSEFTGFVRRGLKQFIGEQINVVLRSASHLVEAGSNGEPGDSSPAKPEAEVEETAETGIVTTEVEVEGFHIVRAILAQTIDPERVVMRDVIGCCGVLIDDNNRKPICRLYFNNPRNKRLGLFDHSDEGRSEERVELESLSSIYQYAERLKATVAYYESTAGTSTAD